MLINSNRVHEIFMDCLFKEGEDHNEYLPASGVTIKAGLHPKRTESYADEIHEILLNLPEVFQEGKGSGYTFMNMVSDKEGNLCMEQDIAQELLMLGTATGWASMPLPRDVWAFLPGGVPYVTVLNQRKVINTITHN